MHELVLEVEDFADLTRWRWVLKDRRGGFLGDHDVNLDPRDAEYEAFIDLAKFLWRRVASGTRGDENAELLRIGRWAASKVFGGLTKILQTYAPVTVRVVVPAEAEELVLRPLEAATIDDLPLPLAGITLVYEVSGDPTAPREVEPAETLRILAVFSLPPAESPLNLREERQALLRLARELSGGARRLAVEVRTLQYGATRETLREALDDGEGWDIIHFSGHGQPGRLALEREDGTTDILHAGELVEMLRPARTRLALVTVSACHSGAGAMPTLLAGVGINPPPPKAAGEQGSQTAASPIARALTKALDCAVVAMRFPVEDHFAIAYAERLFHQLLDNQVTLPQAFQRALSTAHTEPDASPLSRLTPALFGRRCTGLRVTVPRAASSAFTAPDTGMFAFPAAPARFVGRVATMTRASAALAPRSGSVGVVFFGMAGAGKSACAIELAYHMRQTQRFKAWVWYKAPDRGRDITTALRDFALAMEAQLPGLSMLHVVGRKDELEKWLPRLKAVLAEQAILVTLDNIESLLTDAGAWRDPQFGDVVAALLTHGGLSRVVMTSQVRPSPLLGNAVLETVHTLSLIEAALLMSQPPRLYRLFYGDSNQRALARRLLNVVQGHPKLIELAEGMAADIVALEAQVSRAERDWAHHGSPTEVFFREGESQISDSGFFAALAHWADRSIAALPAAAKTFFILLCLLEADDRTDAVLATVVPRLLPNDPPFADLARPLVAAGLIEHTSTDGVGIWSVHPGVAARGSAIADTSFRNQVDETLADFWCAGYQISHRSEARGTGAWILKSALSAIPYLLRLRRWAAASTFLEHVLLRHDSPGTAAMLLPWLREIAAATVGTEEELFDRAKLARALRSADQPADAEKEMREILAAATERRQFRFASAVAGDLVNLLVDRGHLDEALHWTDEKAKLSEEAGLGPWTQLSDETKRLAIMANKGEYDPVLKAVIFARRRLSRLRETTDNETVIPWNVRESLLDIGRSVSLQRRQWKRALRFNAMIAGSQIARQADELKRSRMELNDYLPLIELGRFDEVSLLLDRCRITFEKENYVEGLAAVFSAMASLEHSLHGPGAARPLGERALRYQYLVGKSASCAVAHFNLSNFILWDRGSPRISLAHRLAAILIGLLTTSDMLQNGFDALVVQIIDLDDNARVPMPKTFMELRDVVEQIEGVRFGSLVDALNKTAANLDNVVLALVAKGFQLVAEAPPHDEPP